MAGMTKHFGNSRPRMVAEPTCDEMDVLYDRAGYAPPLDLKVGDRIEV